MIPFPAPIYRDGHCVCRVCTGVRATLAEQRERQQSVAGFPARMLPSTDIDRQVVSPVGGD